MTTKPKNYVSPDSPLVLRSRKVNRRTLKGCVTQLERIQQQIRNVGIQYTEENPDIFRALHSLHENLDLCKPVLSKVGNML